MAYSSLLIVLGLFVFSSNGYTLEKITKDNMDFSQWDKVVRALVKVDDSIANITLNSFDYSGLKNNWHFKNFTWQVENADLTGLNFDQFKAFWINVYNYLAIRIVFDHVCVTDTFGECGPLESIRQVGVQQPSFLRDTVWGMAELNITSLKKKLSLDDIEVSHLRNPPNKWAEDVRIHAAIVCASISCPNLRNEAYVPDRIDAQLTDNAKNFLLNKKKGAAVEGDVLRVSAIFDFFPGDFDNSTKNTNSKSLVWFLSTYGPADVKEFLNLKKNPHPTIKFFSYDWYLNGSVKSLCGEDRVCVPWWSFLVIGLLVVIIIAACFYIIKRKKRSDYDALN